MTIWQQVSLGSIACSKTFLLYVDKAMKIHFMLTKQWNTNICMLTKQCRKNKPWKWRSTTCQAFQILARLDQAVPLLLHRWELQDDQNQTNTTNTKYLEKPPWGVWTEGPCAPLVLVEAVWTRRHPPWSRWCCSPPSLGCSSSSSPSSAPKAWEHESLRRPRSPQALSQSCCSYSPHCSSSPPSVCGTKNDQIFLNLA